MLKQIINSNMGYKIIEIHLEYSNNELSLIAVMWQSNERGWVRASYCNTDPRSGYISLMPGEILSPKLIQQVAGQGMNLPDNLKRKYFPGKKPWEQ
jgi:hypothetical protein